MSCFLHLLRVCYNVNVRVCECVRAHVPAFGRVCMQARMCMLAGVHEYSRVRACMCAHPCTLACVISRTRLHAYVCVCVPVRVHMCVLC